MEVRLAKLGNLTQETNAKKDMDVTNNQVKLCASECYIHFFFLLHLCIGFSLFVLQWKNDFELWMVGFRMN